MGLKKPLSDATKRALLKKASESEFTFAQLAHVYRRGREAYLSGGDKKVSMSAWAMARVNSFISGKGGARKKDQDIAKNRFLKRIKEDTYEGIFLKNIQKKENQVLTLPSGVTVSLAPDGKYEILEDTAEELIKTIPSSPIVKWSINIWACKGSLGCFKMD